MYDPIAYTYEADTHCPADAMARFGPSAEGIDSEGNPVGAIFPWDEWCEPSDVGAVSLVCGTCHGEIDSHEHTPTA